MNLLWWLKHSSVSENELKKQCECLQSWFSQFLVQSASVFQKLPLCVEHSRFTFFMLLTLAYLSLVINFTCFIWLSLASWRCFTLVLHVFFPHLSSFSSILLFSLSLLFGGPKANFRPLTRRQSHWPHVNHTNISSSTRWSPGAS